MRKITVAVIDSGVDKSDSYFEEKDIEDLYYENQEFKACYAGKINPHGTEIIKVLLKEAPDIRILSIRILQENNRCMLSAVIKAMDFCIDQKVDVINLSLGSCSSTSARLGELQDVCNKAIDKGIAIFAADNNRAGKKSYPANFPNVIGVATVESKKDYCKVSYENKVVEFSDNFVYIPDYIRCIVRRGNSYLCPLLVGLFCRFIEGKEINIQNINLFLDFLEEFSKRENISRIYFDKYDEKEKYSLNEKKVLFFADDMDLNNVQIYNMYKEVCDIRLCFDEIIAVPYEGIPRVLEDIDIFFIGALSNRFIHNNKEYLEKLIFILMSMQVEVITVFPIVNTYERMIQTQKIGGCIKSIYK